MKLAMMKAANGSFIPVDEDAAETLRKVAIGSEEIFEYKPSRNPRYHGLAFSFLKFVFANQDKYEIFEDMLTEVKLRTGHYREHITRRRQRDGSYAETLMYVPKSVSFEKFSQDEFEAFMNKAIDFCLRDLCHGMSREDLERAVTWI